jgi:hypothetical protein
VLVVSGSGVVIVAVSPYCCAISAVLLTGQSRAVSTLCKRVYTGGGRI